jgi:hypothetical protein
MKKILPLLLLSLVLLISGCSSSSSSYCTFSGLTPYGGYLIFYTSNGSQTAITRYASANGTITVYLYASSCSSAAVVAIINSGYTLTATPSSIDLNNPPATVTITGQGFDTTYGMPRVEYFDGNGFLLGSVYANSVSGGGTSLEANVPNLSSAYSGTYQIRVTNKTYLGYYNHIVGFASVTAFGRDRPDSDGDGYYDDQDCAPYDPYMWVDCGTETCGGYGDVPPTLCGPVY